MISGRHHDDLGRPMLGVRQEMTPESMILFLDVGIQIKVDFDRARFVLKDAQSTEVDSAPFLTFWPFDSASALISASNVLLTGVCSRC
jgi:hypothetical protein